MTFIAVKDSLNLGLR
jgi:hypothetical protein